MKRWMGCALVALTFVGCAAPHRPTPHPIQPSGTVPDLAGSAAADAERSDADACLARAPQTAACQYGRAVALGLEARAHPTRAGELLTTMLSSLAAAEALDPAYDEAGPARVSALVLIRAPGWPLGPGDTEAGLAAARRAVTLRPEYPPNLLALAEALAKNGDSPGARAYYERAREAAQALPSAEKRDGWLREADEALRPR